MTTLTFKTERYFATTQLEAEALVNKIKQEQGSYVKQTTIAKRIKKDQEYFLVTVTLEICKVNDLLAED